MANDRRIKGLTIEIGGDTTQLSESLHDVNKSITSTQAQLKDVEKLLKLDPTNTEMLAQKQELLTQAISKTEEKLETLKDAAVQAEKQLGEGKISQEQFAALQREIAATEIELKRYDSQLDTAADATENLGDAAEQAAQDSGEASEEIGELSDAADDLGDAAEDAGDGTKDLGESARDSGDGFSVLDGAVATFIGNGLTALVSAIGDAISTFAELSESTQEYRENMSKLYTATSAAGMDADYITQAYSQLYGVLGDETATTTTISNFEKLGVSMQDMDSLLDSATGIWAVYGDSIPLDGLAESVNETAKVGQITGTMADAINWASASNDTWTNALSGNAAALSAFQSGVSQGMSAEDAFNEALAACGDEQERQQLIISTLNGLYADSAETYRENNASIIDAREATVNYQDAVAGVGAAMEPLQTTMTNFKANLISGVSPALQELSDAFIDVITGADGAEEGIASAVTGLVDTVSSMASDLLPQLLEMGTQILGGIMQGLAQSTPTLMATVSDMILQLIQAITAFLPQFAEAAVTIAGSIVTQLTAFVPQLLQAAITLLMAIVDALPAIIDALVAAIPVIITTLVDFFTNNIDTILDAAIQLLMALVDAIPEILVALGNALPQIISAILNAVVDAVPKLLKKSRELFGKIMEALGELLGKLPGKMLEVRDSIVNGIRNSLGSIGSAAADIVSAIWDHIKELPGMMLDVGRDLVEGLWNGISDMVGWIGDKISGFGDSVLGGLKDFFGIASPSKVMRDEVGKFLPAGIAIGIEDSTLSAVKSVRSMADKLRNTAVESLNGMTSGAAYRMQQNPMTAAVRKNAAVVNNYYKTDNSRTVNQTNTSPKALSRLEIYRQTNNALNR